MEAPFEMLQEQFEFLEEDEELAATTLKFIISIIEFDFLGFYIGEAFETNAHTILLPSKQ